jgi:hypothetical protein
MELCWAMMVGWRPWTWERNWAGFCRSIDGQCYFGGCLEQGKRVEKVEWQDKPVYTGIMGITVVHKIIFLHKIIYPLKSDTFCSCRYLGE